jgi:segregation and condensation protein A
MRRSAVCAHFIASLELVKQGRMDLRQEGGHFSPIHIRARAEAEVIGDDDPALMGQEDAL